jgi:Flp pilus assembly protein TadB
VNNGHTDDRPSFGEMLGQVADLSAGLGILLLPALAIALPGVILMLVLPAVLLAGAVAAPLVLAGALVGPPYLLVRAVRRRRART